MNTTTNRLATALAAAGVAASLVLAGCSSSGEGADKATTTTKADAPATTATTKAAAEAPASRAAFCQDVKTAFGDYQPGFDAIFANGNDDPTLDEWAAFLPKPVGEFDAVIAKVEEVEPPADDPEITEAYDTAIAAFDTVSQNYHDSIEAAAAGDEAEFKRLETKNQSTDIAVMSEAMNTFGGLCGFPQG